MYLYFPIHAKKKKKVFLTNLPDKSNLYYDIYSLPDLFQSEWDLGFSGLNFFKKYIFQFLQCLKK